MFQSYYNLCVGIMSCAIAVFTLCLCRVVFPWIRAELIPWLKEKRLYDTVKKFVRAIEKMAETVEMSGADKKDYVIKMLECKGIKITEEIMAMIEAAVMELDMMLDTNFVFIDDLWDEIWNEDEEATDVPEQENDACEEMLASEGEHVWN